MVVQIVEPERVGDRAANGWRRSEDSKIVHGHEGKQYVWMLLYQVALSSSEYAVMM